MAAFHLDVSSLNPPPTWRGQNDYGDSACLEILLKDQILICSNENLEACAFRGIQQVAVFELRPTSLIRCADPVIGEQPAQRNWSAVVEKHSHYTGASALRAACSSTCFTCSIVTPGNHSTNCDAAAPSSRFAKSAAIGTRVPRNSHAPLTRSGSRSAAGHVDQSIMKRG
jgi:hypothetical protein